MEFILVLQLATVFWSKLVTVITVSGKDWSIIFCIIETKALILIKISVIVYFIISILKNRYIK